MSSKGIEMEGLVRAKHLQLTLTPLWYIMHAWGQQQIIKYQIPHGMLTKVPPPQNSSRPHRQSDFFLPPGRGLKFGVPSAMAAVLSCQPNEGRPQISEDEAHTHKDKARRYCEPKLHLLLFLLHWKKLFIPLGILKLRLYRLKLFRHITSPILKVLKNLTTYIFCILNCILGTVKSLVNL